MGWLRDLPDFRDYTPHQDEPPTKLQRMGVKSSVKSMLQDVGALNAPAAALPPAVSLRSWMSPVEDQESIGSCTANAGVALVEYYERRAFGRHVNRSRLFLYKATRNMMHQTGDTGAYLRTTMGALALFGVPPEEYLPYNIADYDTEPSAFCYAFAQNFQSVQYYRLDPPGTARDVVLDRIKTNVANGLPAMFGFTVYTSISQANRAGGAIPFPTGGESIEGGHAIVVAGYDDTKVIRNTNRGGVATTGAFLIRNSWGTSWGDGGYGWLPYEYVKRGIADDFWCLIKQEWIDTEQFGVEETIRGMVESGEGGGPPVRAQTRYPPDAGPPHWAGPPSSILLPEPHPNNREHVLCVSDLLLDFSRSLHQLRYWR
jgi:C1A family cysteine protease